MRASQIRTADRLHVVGEVATGDYVLTVGTLAHNDGWRSNGVKEYLTEVRVDDLPSDAGLKPGMTAEVKVQVTTLKDVVTHEVGFAREVAHRAVLMDSGAILEEGPPDEFFTRPQHPRTRQFLSSIL